MASRKFWRMDLRGVNISPVETRARLGQSNQTANAISLSGAPWPALGPAHGISLLRERHAANTGSKPWQDCTGDRAWCARWPVDIWVSLRSSCVPGRQADHPTCLTAAGRGRRAGSRRRAAPPSRGDYCAPPCKRRDLLCVSRMARGQRLH